MADYTTIARLNLNADLTGIDTDVRYPEGFDKLMLCCETEDGFDGLLKILNLDIEMLPTIQVKHYKKEFLNKNIDVLGKHFVIEENGFDEDILVTEFSDFHGTTKYWCDDANGWVAYPSMSSLKGYDEENIFVKLPMKVIPFDYLYVSDMKASLWSNWLGKDSYFGDFDCTFFAKDAGKHFAHYADQKMFHRWEENIEEIEELGLNSESPVMAFAFG